MKTSTTFLKKTGVTFKELVISTLTLLAINAILIIPALRLVIRHVG